MIESLPESGTTAATPPDEHPRHGELGSFLRARRERLSPEAVGLPAGRRRRTAGLRREEVAELAGISTDWYIRLEQGRTVSPSPTTVDALARALRLGDAAGDPMIEAESQRGRMSGAWGLG